MLEAKLTQAATLKKLLDACKDLVSEAGFECNDSGIAMQAMDSSHIALVSLLLRAQGFEHYRCDRHASLGVSMDSFGKILKCASNDDILTLRADEKADVLTLMFETQKTDRVSEFEIKLIDIDSDNLGIPDVEYDAVVKMPSREFQRICADMKMLSESVTITCTKEGVRFFAEGDIGSGSVTIRQGEGSIDEEEEGLETTIDMNQPVSLTFSSKYLCDFAKATPLSNSVSLSMSTQAPLLVEYKVSEIGYMRYYLAPKMTDDAN